MKNPEMYLEPYEKKNNKEKNKEKAHEKGMEENNIFVKSLSTLITPDNKSNYATFKHEEKGKTTNVGIQKLHDGYSVLLLRPNDPNNPNKGPNHVLKGIFKLNKAPEFSEMETGKDGRVINTKNISSNPQVAKNFAAIIGGVNKKIEIKESANQ